MRTRDARVLALLVASMAGACGGDGDGACRSGAECDSPEECLPPVIDGPVCGMPCEVTDSCPADGCPEDQVCVQVLGTCCGFGAPLSSLCARKCPEAPCAIGETCDADGRCMADPCTEGYECAAHFVCDPTSQGADFHGCVRGSCSGDSACDGGVCVLGRCYDTAGSCAVPQAVP